MQQPNLQAGGFPDWRPGPQVGDGFQGLFVPPLAGPWGSGAMQPWGIPAASVQLPVGSETCAAVSAGHHGSFHPPFGPGTSLNVGGDAATSATPLPQCQPLSSFVLPPLGAPPSSSQGYVHAALTNGSGGGACAQNEGHVSQEPCTLLGPGPLLGGPLGRGGVLSRRPEGGVSIGSSHGREDGCAVGSSQVVDGGVGSLLPVECANSRVWGVTSEYENLLNIQRDQHNLILRQRDAEVAHLQHTIEALQNGRGNEQRVVARLRTEREDAVQLALEGTRKELTLFASLLQMRDRQIGELQQMCEARQEQIQQLQERLDTAQRATFREEPAAEAAAAAAPSTQEVQALRQEKMELERLLVAKDRQMEATLRAIDPQMADTSALQLGAQAVQMFHDSMKIRADKESLGEENNQLRDKLELVQGRVEELEAEVTERRVEVKELTSTLATKVQRFLELEAAREMEARERRKESKETAARHDKMQDEIADLTEQVNTKQLFIEQLQDDLSERDQRLLQHRADVLHHKACAKRFEQKAEESDARLSGAENTLSELLRDSKQKDQLMREMTEHINVSETKLHSFHINELMSHRKRNVEQRSKEASTTSPATLAPEINRAEKDSSSRFADLQGKAKENSIQSMFGVSGLNQSLNGFGGCGSGGGPRCGANDSGVAIAAANAMAEDPSAELLAPHACINDSSAAWRQLSARAPSGMSSQCASPSQTPVSYSSHQIYGGQAVRLLPASSPLPPNRGLSGGGLSGVGTSSAAALPARQSSAADVAHSKLVRSASHGHLTSSGGSGGGGSHLHTAKGPLGAGANTFLEFNGAVSGGRSAKDSVAASPAAAQPAAMLSLQNYRPHPGDNVDRKVAEFVNEPQNSASQALFCRLGPGSYLYGTQRASLRVHPKTGHLEALHGSDWIPIEDFARRMEDSQGIHIRRAREATVGTPSGSVTIPIGPGRGGGS
eukprot:TRINITY_DN3860_c0_g1_i2.p1 TRINITY_DN3860_c0_g1~~TRINITY_DN3860_c0_g1_i2.p1  ORF type:complete len:955 (+),score=179.89 TRINITY_DN3860_c0_g1_i2:167-3031(+)